MQIAFNLGELLGALKRGDTKAGHAGTAALGGKAAGDEIDFSALIDDLAGAPPEDAISTEAEAAAEPAKPAPRAASRHLTPRRAPMEADPSAAAASSTVAIASAGLEKPLAVTPDDAETAAAPVVPDAPVSTATAKAPAPALPDVAPTPLAFGATQPAELSDTGERLLKIETAGRPQPVIVIDRRTHLAPVRQPLDDKVARAVDAATEAPASATPASEALPPAKPAMHIAASRVPMDRPAPAPAALAPADRPAPDDDRRDDPADDRRSPPATDRTAEAAAPVKEAAVAVPALRPTEVVRIADAIRGAAAEIASSAPAPDAADLAPRPAGVLRTLSIQLHPADLGVVTVHMALRGDHLALHIHAVRKETARLLEEDKDSLSRILTASGYKTDIRGISADIAAASALPSAGEWQASGNSGPPLRQDAGGGFAGGRSGGLLQDDQPRSGQQGQPFMADQEEANETPRTTLRGGDLYV